MGYRSDVVLALKAEIAIETTLFENIQLLKNRDRTYKTNGYIVYYWDNIKWYDFFDDVQAVMSFLDTLSQEQYGFLRLGEDASDIEEKGYPWEFGLWVSREIMVDGAYYD